jgi:hypothetical protein
MGLGPRSRPDGWCGSTAGGGSPVEAVAYPLESACSLAGAREWTVESRMRLASCQANAFQSVVQRERWWCGGQCIHKLTVYAPSARVVGLRSGAPARAHGEGWAARFRGLSPPGYPPAPRRGAPIHNARNRASRRDAPMHRPRNHPSRRDAPCTVWRFEPKTTACRFRPASLAYPFDCRSQVGNDLVNTAVQVASPQFHAAGGSPGLGKP